jgi:hypothetical protein
MTSTTLTPRAVAEPTRPPATAALPTSRHDQRLRNVQVALFTVGALFMPIGVFAIVLGWYGVAHAKYQYDQLPYVVSGGLLGLGLVFIGGFVYFGAWLARIGTEQRESSRQLADAVLMLVEHVGPQGRISDTETPVDAAADALALAGSGSTVHRRDCPLIAHRDDLHALMGREPELRMCRVCRPDPSGHVLGLDETSGRRAVLTT